MGLFMWMIMRNGYDGIFYETFARSSPTSKLPLRQFDLGVANSLCSCMFCQVSCARGRM